MTDEDFTTKFSKSITPGKVVVKLELDTPHALVLISTIQLALRHPLMPPSIPPLAREIVDTVIQAFPLDLQAELRKGYNRRFDRKEKRQ